MKICTLSYLLWRYASVLSLLLYTTLGLNKSVVAHTAGATPSPSVAAQATSDPHHLRAVRSVDGIVVEWQTPLSAQWSAFQVYYSQDCRWETAHLVTAPLFASVNSETALVTYSLLDEAINAPPTCSYWLVGIEGDGSERTFGPVEVQGRFGLYLPLVYR